MVIDTRSQEVTVHGEPLALTPLEYALLAFLTAAPRQVFSTGQILDQIWSPAHGRQDGSSVAEHVYPSGAS